MKNIKLETTFNNVSEVAIKRFEKTYNLTLPREYKQFMLANNGGKPIARRFVTKDGKQTSSLMLLYPISQEESPNMSMIYEEINERIPGDLLVIGEDPIDNKICLSLSGKDKGAVYYWSLDMEDSEEPSYEHFSLVADRFSEFMSNLYVPS